MKAHYNVKFGDTLIYTINYEVNNFNQEKIVNFGEICIFYYRSNLVWTELEFADYPVFQLNFGFKVMFYEHYC